jgi:hypothetical protein
MNHILNRDKADRISGIYNQKKPNQEIAASLYLGGFAFSALAEEDPVA